MMDVQTIRRMADDAARKAARQKKVPRVVWDDTTVEQDLRGIPFLGDYVPKGWEVATYPDGDEVVWFVDSSGFGAEDEPALSYRRFVEKVRELLRERKGDGHEYGFGVIEAGQFQVYVKAYRHKVKRAA